jgi:glycosyltransferase involved in cell wall biosynthesis
MRIIILPIEPLVERYTESWYNNIPKYFKSKGCEVITIDGTTLIDTVKVGTFLDINSTVHYKNSQLQIVARMFHENTIQDEDIFFISDLEFWGVESIRLLAQLNNKKIKIAAFLHAASYTIEDAFSVAEPYQKFTELGWLLACDFVFVGSEYHKKAIMERRVYNQCHVNDASSIDKKIIVTGNPLFKDDYKDYELFKQYKLIISNRFDYEKRPNLSLNFAYLLKKRNPNLEIVVTTSRSKFTSNRNWLVEYARELEKDKILKIYEGLSKEEYHKHLSESILFITNSIEENFGYCLLEAIIYNVSPLAPNSCSHSEILDNDPTYLFDNEDEILGKAQFILDNYTTGLPNPVKKFTVDLYYKSMDKIYDCLKC